MRINGSRKPMDLHLQLDVLKYLINLNEDVDPERPFGEASELAIDVAVKKVKCEQARRFSQVRIRWFEGQSLATDSLGYLNCFDKNFRERAKKFHKKGKYRDFIHLFKRLHQIHRQEYLDARRAFSQERGTRWLTHTEEERETLRLKARRRLLAQRKQKNSSTTQTTEQASDS